jgi:hypothetical protein
MYLQYLEYLLHNTIMVALKLPFWMHSQYNEPKAPLIKHNLWVLRQKILHIVILYKFEIQKSSLVLFEYQRLLKCVQILVYGKLFIYVVLSIQMIRQFIGKA